MPLALTHSVAGSDRDAQGQTNIDALPNVALTHFQHLGLASVRNSIGLSATSYKNTT